MSRHLLRNNLKNFIHITQATEYAWNGATWAVDGNGRAYNIPVLGSEILVDGGMENWTNTTNLTNWNEGLAGATTINQEASVIHGGTYASRVDVDASNSFASIFQAFTAVVGQWLQASAWMRSSVASGKLHRLDMTNTNNSIATFPLTNVYQHFFVTGRALTVAPNVSLVRQTASHSAYIDDVSVKPLTTNTLFASMVGLANTLPVAAKINVLNFSTHAGVVSLLDSTSNPNNFLIAYHDGVNVLLDKCVAGVYTNLVSVAVAFVTNAQIEIRRPSGNTFQVWYNGIQRGVDQTVSDAGIIGNNLYGIFSTHSTNRFSEFSLNNNIIPFTLPIIP